MTAAFRRFAVGPLASIAMAGGLWLLDRFGLSVPTPGAFILLTVIYATWVGGLASGYVSAAIGVAATLPLLFEPARFLTFVSEPWLLIEIMLGFSIGLPLVTAGLRMRATRMLDAERRTRERVEAASRELRILQAALDNVDYGVLLLDESLRARFVNRASRQLWRMSDALADSRPSFLDLMRHACDSGAFALPASEIDAYVARRVALVRAGDETPIDLRLANGRCIRFQCKALPEGGRFLGYTDVSDLVRDAEEFERLATTDSLTGVHNRRHFLALADEEWRRFQREDAALALLILDIDLFKSINDRFGHDVGDAVITHVVDICREEARSADILARIGGEEFVLLLPETSQEQAVMLAETVRQRLDAAPLAIEGNSMRVTISVGVAQADAGMSSIGDLMKRADQALYEAKRGGRNRVRSAGPAQRNGEDTGASAAA
jgi:diguanylate cyclase (GGDEF)-like protein